MKMYAEEKQSYSIPNNELLDVFSQFFKNYHFPIYNP